VKGRRFSLGAKVLVTSQIKARANTCFWPGKARISRDGEMVKFWMDAQKLVFFHWLPEKLDDFIETGPLSTQHSLHQQNITTVTSPCYLKHKHAPASDRNARALTVGLLKRALLKSSKTMGFGVEDDGETLAFYPGVNKMRKSVW
jgi:hypothetical protein